MEKDIGKLQKNNETDIIIRIDDFGGKRGLTIREFVSSERYTGFTKAGVRIPSKDFESFKEMINSISSDEMNESPEQETLDNEAPSESSQENAEQKDSSQSPEEMPDY